MIPHAWRIKRFSVLPSTNATALDLARSGAPAWTVVVADAQTGGRGRLQRVWHSPAGHGLYFSIILHPALALESFPCLTLATGVAVCQALESAGVPAARLKWPNDILLAGRKAGGILTETGPVSGPPGAPSFVVIGIGLNVSTPLSSFPLSLRDKATSIHLASGLDLDRECLLRTILEHLREAVALLEDGRMRVILEEWSRRDGTKGRNLVWLTVAGRQVEGTGLGIDASGRYRIRDHNGTIHDVLSGDLDLAMDGRK